MKSSANMGYPRLCLWLFASLLITSCAAMRTAYVAPYPVAHVNEPAGWLIEVLIGWNSDAPYTEGLNGLAIIPQQVKRLFNPSQPQLLVLSFRLKNAADVELLKEQLYASGTVRQLTISPELSK